jgi:hypothetical protein
MIMTDPEGEFTLARREWMERPDDIRQTALAVIATTRYAWAVQCAADEPTADCTRFADPLFRLALDVTSSSAARARAIRTRSRRRATGLFAI